MSKSTDGVQIDVFERKEWVSSILPSPATALLVRAADKARTLPVGSLARTKCIEDAIVKARALYPKAFNPPETPEGSGA